MGLATARWLGPLAAVALAACGGDETGQVFAPGIAEARDADPLATGHRLMEAGEYELALSAYTRAAAREGLTVDTLSGLGTANLALGRLGQSERLLRQAVEVAPDFPPAWNNLGVLLMERGVYGEAAEVFRRAFATDNGNSEQIRANLARALAKRDGSLTDELDLSKPDLVVPIYTAGDVEPL